MSSRKEIIEKVDSIRKELELDEVIGIYLIGSRLYKTATEDSDYDYIVVTEDLIKINVIHDEKETKLSFHFQDFETIKNLIEEHNSVYLPILYLPKDYVILETENLATVKKDWKFRLDMLETSVNEEVNICLMKSLRYFDTNKRLGLKNIIHAIRYILFGIQMINSNKIYDFICANDYFKEIFTLNYQTLEQYNSHYLSIIERLKKEFIETINSKKSLILKEIYKPRGSFATIDFLKFRTLDDLIKYFSIQVKEIEGFIILLGKNSNEDLISKECAPLILDAKCNFVAKHFNHQKVSSDSYFIEISYYYLTFYHQENWWRCKIDLKIDKRGFDTNILEENVDEPDTWKVYFVVNKKIFWEMDKNTLEERGLFMNDLLHKKHTKEFENHSYYLGDTMKDYLFFDSLNNMQIIVNPFYELIEQIKKKKIDYETGILTLFKNFEIDQEILENEDLIFDHTKISLLYKKIVKFKGMIQKEYKKVQDMNQDEFNEYCKDLIIGDLLKAMKNEEKEKYYRKISIEEYKNLLEYKKFLQYNPKLKREMNLLKFNLSEPLPKDIISVIIDFLDQETILSLSISSKQFQCILSSSYKAKEIIKRGSKNILEEISPYYQTPESQIFIRTSYLKNRTFSLKLFDHLYLFKPRELNQFEKEIFSTPKSNPISKILVSNQKEFLENLNKIYGFEDWKKVMDFGVFYLRGFSVLNALLKNPIQLNVLNIGYSGFDRKFYEFLQDFSDYRHFTFQVDDYSGDYVQGNFKYEGRKIKILFVREAAVNYDNEFDSIEVYYDGNDVFCSRAFIESFNTGTFLAFGKKLNVNDIMIMKSIGFEFIISKEVDTNIVEEKEKEIEEKLKRKNKSVENDEKKQEEKIEDENNENDPEEDEEDEDEDENEKDENEEEEEDEEEEDEIVYIKDFSDDVMKQMILLTTGISNEKKKKIQDEPGKKKKYKYE